MCVLQCVAVCCSVLQRVAKLTGPVGCGGRIDSGICVRVCVIVCVRIFVYM